MLIQLYVDDKTELTTVEMVTTNSGKKLTTIGKKWSHLQGIKFRANSQPYYVLLNAKTEQPLVPPSGADYSVDSYLAFLQSGVAKK